MCTIDKRKLEMMEVSVQDIMDLVRYNREFVGNVERTTPISMSLVYKDHNIRLTECCNTLEYLAKFLEQL